MKKVNHISPRGFKSILMFFEETNIEPSTKIGDIDTSYKSYKKWLEDKGGLEYVESTKKKEHKDLINLIIKVWLRSGADDTKKRESSHKRKYLFWFLRTKLKVELTFKQISRIAMCDKANVMFHLKDAEFLDKSDKLFRENTKDLKEDLNKTLIEYIK